MTYQVVISARAERELLDAVTWIAERSPEAAIKWHEGFIAHLKSLSHNPERYGLAPESLHVKSTLRQTTFGKNRSYRALYTVSETTVNVLLIHHTARDQVNLDDFEID